MFVASAPLLVGSCRSRFAADVPPPFPSTSRRCSPKGGRIFNAEAACKTQKMQRDESPDFVNSSIRQFVNSSIQLTYVFSLDYVVRTRHIPRSHAWRSACPLRPVADQQPLLS